MITIQNISIDNKFSIKIIRQFKNWIVRLMENIMLMLIILQIGQMLKRKVYLFLLLELTGLKNPLREGLLGDSLPLRLTGSSQSLPSTLNYI